MFSRPTVQLHSLLLYPGSLLILLLSSPGASCVAEPPSRARSFPLVERQSSPGLGFPSSRSLSVPSAPPSQSLRPYADFRGALRERPADSRCRSGDDPQCRKSVSEEVERGLRNYQHEERARLGQDFCLFNETEPGCRQEREREAQRADRELKYYCAGNPDAPRCSEESGAKGLMPSRRAAQRPAADDDFFGNRGELPDPSNFQDDRGPLVP